MPEGRSSEAVTEPTISIITPAYNSARFIEETVGSVRAQTFPDWELLVVDNGSQDGTGGIVRRWAGTDPRIRLLTQVEHRGPGAARNLGLDHACGRYVAFLDSDDLWLPHKLETQVGFMRSRDAAFSFTAYSIIDEGGAAIGNPVRVPARIDYRGLLKNTIIGCLTVMLDRTRTGPLRMPDLPQHEDLVLWLRLLENGTIAYGIPEVLARYRVVRGSASRNKLRSALHMWKVYRGEQRLALPHAAWCYAHYAWRAYRKNRF